jgi:hypothetical protein
MKKTALRYLVCLVTLTGGIVWGQQSNSVPPPPRLPEEESSLGVTMNFIRSGLTEGGSTIWALHVRDDDGVSWTIQQRIELSDVIADWETCRVNYRRKLWSNGWVFGDTSAVLDESLDLANVQDVTVLPVEQDRMQIDRNSNTANWEYASDPSVFAVTVRSEKGGPNSFYFFDQVLANRVAKSIVRAAELCGSGK